MPRYKNYSYEQGLMLPIHLDKQLQPGTFEYGLNYIIDKEIDLTSFESKIRNDLTGAPAFDPRIMLKIVLFAYSRGIYSSRDIEDCCKHNVIFIALSADSHPHFTTIARFISSLQEELIDLFVEVLVLCDKLDLIGYEMFAIDGCKVSSNASKESSGTRADFIKKKAKLEKTVRYLVEKHKRIDAEESGVIRQKEEKSIEGLRKKIKKIKEWLDNNDDKQGTSGKINKSNMTDNESMKMPSSHGVIQGYNNIAVVDSKHQIIMHPQAYGSSEQSVLPEVVEETNKKLEGLGKSNEEIKQAKWITDSGFHNKDNVAYMEDKDYDAYMPDNKFRQRDPRFSDSERYKQPVDRKGTSKARKYFAPSDFRLNEKTGKLICPAGSELYVKNRNFSMRGRKAIAYMGKKTDCRVCKLKSKCIRNKKTEARQVHIFYDSEDRKNKLMDKMREKIDSDYGKYIYSRRMGIVEPVFANIRHNLGLSRFTLRGRKKVNIQWTLYSIVHNIFKIVRFGYNTG